MGKELGKATVAQHMRHLKQFLIFSGEKSLGLREAMSADNANKFLTCKKFNDGKEMLNSTMRLYVSSLHYLVRYLILNSDEPQCPSSAELDKFSQQISDMSSGMKKGCLKEIWVRQQLIMKKLPNSQEAEAYIICQTNQVLV